ncbi:MAG: hypothetical protein LBT47_00970 [Deltaproteobacteria bacterium]|nr:hypothetical protein [Deltaproteobacteria bacterium]
MPTLLHHYFSLIFLVKTAPLDVITGCDHTFAAGLPKELLPAAEPSILWLGGQWAINKLSELLWFFGEFTAAMSPGSSVFYSAKD